MGNIDQGECMRMLFPWPTLGRDFFFFFLKKIQKSENKYQNTKKTSNHLALTYGKHGIKSYKAFPSGSYKKEKKNWKSKNPLRSNRYGKIAVATHVCSKWPLFWTIHLDDQHLHGLYWTPKIRWTCHDNQYLMGLILHQHGPHCVC